MRISRRSIFPMIICVAAMVTIAPTLHGQNNGGNPQQGQLRFQRFVIKDDPNYTGLDVCGGLMPAGWTKEGGVEWDLRDDRPAQLHVHFSNPHGVAAYDMYPNQFFYWNGRLEGKSISPEYRYIGALVRKPPADQFEALEQFVIARYRPELAQARVVEKMKLPDAAKVAFETMPKGGAGVYYSAAVGRETFEYEMNGRMVQEEFFVTFETEVNQRLGYMGWQILNVNSTRGLKGRLGELNILRAVMAKSFRMNIEWYTKITNFVIMRHKMTLDQLQQQERQREILMHMQQEINDQERKEFEQHWADEDRQSDQQADYMREVSPWRTSDGGTVKLPNEYGRAWEGADGEIIMTNDGGYDPNTDPNTNTRWTPMEQKGY